jgi:hypothetical protein
MGKGNTYFEQVPIALAKRVAQAEAQLSQEGMIACAICGLRVELEHCKIDEDGGAVHDKCYLASIITPSRLQRSRFGT